MNMVNIRSANRQHVNIVTLSVLACSSYHGRGLSLVSCSNESENKLHQTLFFNRFQKKFCSQKKYIDLTKCNRMGFKKPVFIDSTTLASYWAAITTGQMKSEVEYGVQLNIFWLNEQSWLLDFTLEKMRTSYIYIYKTVTLYYNTYNTVLGNKYKSWNSSLVCGLRYITKADYTKITWRWCYTVQNKSSWKQFYNS